MNYNSSHRSFIYIFYPFSTRIGSFIFQWPPGYSKVFGHQSITGAESLALHRSPMDKCNNCNSICLLEKKILHSEAWGVTNPIPKLDRTFGSATKNLMRKKY